MRQALKPASSPPPHHHPDDLGIYGAHDGWKGLRGWMNRRWPLSWLEDSHCNSFPSSNLSTTLRGAGAGTREHMALIP